MALRRSEDTVLEAKKSRTKPPPMFKVLLLNDDYTPMDFVVLVLQKIFALSRERATQVTRQRPDIRVMLMSGYTDQVEGDSTWPLLQKPFTPDVLARKVREVLDGAVGSR